MAQTTTASIEGRIADLEAFARSWSAGNVTERASVVNAAGRHVPLSQLAFGLVTASDPATTSIDAGTPGAPGGLGWYYGTPQLDVLVSGGNLLVLTAAALHSQGNKAGMYQSYRLLGPAPDEAALVAGAAAGTLAVAAAPSYDRAVMTFDPGVGQGTDVGAGTFGVHSGLAAGWYRVQSAYAITYSASMYTYGSAANRRIAAMPF